MAPAKRLAELLPGTPPNAYMAEAVRPPVTMRYCRALLARMSMLEGSAATWPACRLDCVCMMSKVAEILNTDPAAFRATETVPVVSLTTVVGVLPMISVAVPLTLNCPAFVIFAS